MAWIRCMGGNAAKTVGTDKVPYLFRATPFDANLKKMKLVGGSVAFNQLYNKTTTQTEGGITYTNTNGVITLSGLATANYFYTYNITIPTGHKVLLSGADPNGASNTAYLYASNSDAYYNLRGGKTATVFSIGSNTNVGVSITTKTGYNADNNPMTFKPNVIDLTAMFGSMIADYIYSLEQGTAGAGVAFFRKLFDNDDFAFNAGELLSVKTSAHEVVGFNAWDGMYEANKWLSDTNGTIANQEGYNLTGYIPVLPNTIYYKSRNESARILQYDSDKNVISGQSWGDVPSNVGVFTTRNNAHYIRFVITDDYLDTFILNLSSSRNGEYEPYKKYTYPLDGTKRVYRKYGIVDLGSLSWTYDTQYSRFLSERIPSLSPIIPVRTQQLVCAKYTSIFDGRPVGDVPDKSIYNGGGSQSFDVVDHDYTDATVFKAAVNGVKVIYEILTPFYEMVTNPELRGIFKLDSNNKLYCDGDTCEDIVSPMAMMSGGTEAFVDSRAVPVPVGHESTYYSVDFPE